jgi:hypothetical protein
MARRLRDGYVDDERCAALHTGDSIGALAEPEGPRRHFSVHGYVARVLRIEREIDGVPHRHCISIAWPPGDTNSDGRPVTVAAHVDDGWLRGIENTLARVPWPHVEILARIVIDDRPKEHGIAPFDQNSADDARDGHTIWLHEQLFTEPNHWGRGNYGAYWSYHVDQDHERLDGQPADHRLYSPVFLHELGHLVAYNVVNRNAADPSAPRCAKMCGDRGGCEDLTPADREAPCISPYCMPFNVATGTENWAEQYRFYYQSSKTRGLLGRAQTPCLSVLSKHDRERDEARPAPWETGLPDLSKFQRSLWESCGEKACKPW